MILDLIKELMWHLMMLYNLKITLQKGGHLLKILKYKSLSNNIFAFESITNTPFTLSYNQPELVML